jgi:hypothetical protein
MFGINSDLGDSKFSFLNFETTIILVLYVVFALKKKRKVLFCFARCMAFGLL